MDSPSSILVIPDGHAHPDFDNDRFDWLGRYILDTRPDVIVNIGDLGDFPSLSSYDKGTKGFEGRRLQRDLAALYDAQDKIFAPTAKWNKRRAKNRKAQYRPRWVMCVGNHEDRLDRAANASSELDGTIGTQLCKYEEYGWEVHPFQQSVEIAGISFCHYFASGVMGRPISGENIGKSLCTKLHMSAVQGHSHVYDHSERSRIDGQKMFGQSCGCFTHPDHVEGWNQATVHLWWRGLVNLKHLDGDGYYDELQTITMRKLRRDYA